jgi:hypothetical protein
MKDNKHIQTFEQHQENLNISDVMNSIVNEIYSEIDSIEKTQTGFEYTPRTSKSLDETNKIINVKKDTLKHTLSLIEKHYRFDNKFKSKKGKKFTYYS